MSKSVRQLRRLSEIVAVFTAFYWHGFIQNRGNHEIVFQKRALLLRQSLEKLGSVFVKFGQLLSLRPDFLSPFYCRELFYLLEDVPPFPYLEVEKIIKEDFGTTPIQLFKSFQKTPCAAASFGQVHVAYLRSGEKVAIKIRRPLIKETVEEDIVLMKILSKLIDLLPLGPNKLGPLIQEFEIWTRGELDYKKEADYTEKYYLSVVGNPKSITGPKIYRDFCSERVLTTEFIEGVTLYRVLLAIRNKDSKTLRKLKQMGFSQKSVAEAILQNTIRQVFLQGVFHADPHPANIIFMPSGKLAYIDFGNYGEIDQATRIKELRYLRSLFYHDKENAFEALCSLCDISQVKDLPSFRKEHDRIVDETMEALENNKNNPQVLGGKKLMATLNLNQRYKVKIPYHMVKYFRMMGILESLVISLYPQIKISDLAAKFRNVSIVNLLVSLPAVINKENFDSRLLRWVNLLEKEITKNVVE